MSTLKILHLEDNLLDAELLVASLSESGIDCQVVRVDTEEDFTSSLKQGGFDLIVSDYSLPGFSGKSALTIARHGFPHVPFIFVSGTIGEDAAIESLTNGATDYVLKHKFSRLVPAIQRAQRDAEERRLRRDSEEALRQSEEKYRSLFEESKDAVVIISPNGTFVDINPSGVELLGYTSKHDVVGIVNIRDHYHDAEKGGDFKKVIEEQARVRNFELRLTRKDRKVVTVVGSASPELDDNGNTISYRGIWHDVTEQRMIEAQFLRAQRIESIGMLASGIAHDLNNILAPILMAVQLLKLRARDEKDQTTLDTLEISARRGADLVKQVLAFGRGAEGQRAPLQLRHAIRDVEKIMIETFPKSIRVETECPKDLWTIYGDNTQLHQVLMNLCVNARDAMSSGGKLTIRTRNVTLVEELKCHGFTCDPGHYVLLEVLDSGEGIPDELLSRIFDAFFTTKEPGKGTGLGLSTVQTVVRNHLGAIDIESRIGEGTCFKVYLPALQSSVSHSEKHAEEIPAGNGELVLVVDDEAAIRDICRATLEAYGYRVLVAGDGAEGVKMFLQYKDEVRLVLTDGNMPTLNGARMVQTMQRQQSKAQIVFMSGVARKASDLGSDVEKTRHFIAKPFTAPELLRTLSEALKVH